MADINTVAPSDGGAKKIHSSLCMTTPKTVAIAADATVGSFTINATALTHTIVLKIPTYTNVETATISIENSNGDEIYSNGTLAKFTTHIIAVSKPLVGDNTVKITLSGVPGDAIEPETTFYLVGAS